MTHVLKWEGGVVEAELRHTLVCSRFHATTFIILANIDCTFLNTEKSLYARIKRLTDAMLTKGYDKLDYFKGRNRRI